MNVRLLPDAWRLPLHHIYHSIGEGRKYSDGSQSFKVMRGSREHGRAERLVADPRGNGRVSHWTADVVFGEDNFVWMSGWNSEQVLNRDGSVWKIRGHPSSAPSVKLTYEGEWWGQR